MRCPDCNKFVAQEQGDPEIEIDLSLPEPGENPPTASFNATARVVIACADCGTELKEATLDFDGQFSESAIAAHVGDGHDLLVEVEDEESTDRVEGRGRGARTYYGAKFTAVLRCKCQRDIDKPVDTIECEDEIQASAMDELT